MTIGKMKGVIVRQDTDNHRPAHHVADKRTARASVRESSLMMLNGSMITVGFI